MNDLSIALSDVREMIENAVVAGIGPHNIDDVKFSMREIGATLPSIAHGEFSLHISKFDKLIDTLAISSEVEKLVVCTTLDIGSVTLKKFTRMLQDFDYNPGEVDGMAYWEFDWANSAHTKMYYIVKKGTDAFDVIETEGFMHDAKDKRVVSSGNHTRIVTELLHLNSKIVLRASRSADADPDVA